MQRRYFFVVTCKKTPKTPNQQMMLIADPLKCLIQVFTRVGILFVSGQPAAASLVSLVVRFSEHPHPLQESCDKQSAPCLQGGNIPLKSWPRWVMSISFGRADDAEKSQCRAEHLRRMNEAMAPAGSWAVLNEVRNSCQISLCFTESQNQLVLLTETSIL